MYTINGPADNPLVAKLSQFVSLSTAEIDLLERLCAREEQFKTGTNIFDEGDPPRSIFVITRGMTCRYRLLPDGRRQILTFLIPGDLSELNEYLLKGVDHSMGAIVPTRVAAIERDVVRDIILNHPRLAAAFWWSAMQESAMLRERIVAIGRRNARGRIAYLLCEQVWRQQAIGMAEGHSIRLPLTQIDLADALGLTAVHVNRVLQRFREGRLINLGQRRLTLLNVAKLETIAGLKPAYLQLNSTPPETLRYLDELEGDRGENSG
jgi:CRP-like cAMP-binding protein